MKYICKKETRDSIIERKVKKDNTMKLKDHSIEILYFKIKVLYYSY